jgi:hypothetical protein
MPRFLSVLLCLVALSGCKLVTTDAPFIMGKNGADMDLLGGDYIYEPKYGKSAAVTFRPAGGTIQTAQGPQASMTYAFGPLDSEIENRGELIASRIDGQPDWLALSVSGDLAEMTKDGAWQSDTSAPNYIFAAHLQGEAINIYGFPKDVFDAPLSQPKSGTEMTNAGVAKAEDMRAFLAGFDYAALLKVDPLFILKPKDSVSVSGLLDRNIPNAQKLYEDDSGVYYGAYMTFRDGIPFPSNKNDQYLYVYGVRKPLANGNIIDISPVTLQDRDNKTVAGYRYNQSEITRAQRHIIPALRRAFPNEKRIEKDVMVQLFLEGHHGRWQGQPYGSSQAERAHARLRFIKRGNEYRPEYENLGKTGLPLEGVLNSAAQIKAAHPAMEPSVVTARADNRALYMAFKAKREQFKADQLQTILATMTAQRRAGIVYKTSAFWERYPNFDDVRDIFDGNYDLIDRIGNFANAYTSFARTYDARCRQHLVDPIKRTVTSWKEDEFGIPYDQDTNHYYIDARFYDNFDHMDRLAGQKVAGDMVDEAVKGFKNGDVLAAISNSFAAGMESVVDYVTMRRFIDDHGCLSAPVQQLLHNLVAAPLGKPPVQATRKTYAGAAQASTPYVLADAERFFTQNREKSIREFKAGRTPRIGDSVIRPYLVGQLANDSFRVNNAMNKIGRKIQERAHPVLTCFYGPTRRTDSGVFMYETVKYWYKNKPADWAAFSAAARNTDDIYPGLRHAVQQCPATLADAQALTGPMSDQW